MATTCNFGQIPDIRFTVLCCKSRVVIDRNCNLFIENATVDKTLKIDPGGTLDISNTTVDMRNTLFDFNGSQVIGLNGNISGNIIAQDISGTLVFVNIIGEILGDILGNINGTIVGNVTGTIVGNVDVINLFGELILANNVQLETFTVNILELNEFGRDLCIDSNARVIFKTGSELRGNICIPGNATILFKGNSTVIIDTAFGTVNDGDILYHANGITQVLPIGNVDTILTSNTETIFYNDELCLDTINANIKGNLNLAGSNVSIEEITFLVVNANNVVINDTLNVIEVVFADKIFGNLCGNILGLITNFDCPSTFGANASVFADMTGGCQVIVNGNIIHDGIGLSVLVKGNNTLAKNVYINFPGNLNINGYEIDSTVRNLSFVGIDFQVCNGNLRSDSFQDKDCTQIILSNNSVDATIIANIAHVLRPQSATGTITLNSPFIIAPIVLSGGIIKIGSAGFAEDMLIDQDLIICDRMVIRDLHDKAGTEILNENGNIVFANNLQTNFCNVIVTSANANVKCGDIFFTGDESGVCFGENIENVVFQDDFNRADENPVVDNWQVLTGDWFVSGNELGVLSNTNPGIENHLFANIAQDAIVGLTSASSEIFYSGASTGIDFTRGALQPAKYFILRTPSINYYVWYRVDLLEIDPNPAGATIGILTDILSADNSGQISAKTMNAINAVAPGVFIMAVV